MDNLLIRIHSIVEMIWWTGLAPKTCFQIMTFDDSGGITRGMHHDAASENISSHPPQHVGVPKSALSSE